MSSIVLFEDKKECCGCGACFNACPKKAISMCEDEYGFKYPKINEELCVECGLCKKVCGYQNPPEKHASSKVYAAASKSSDIIKKSASGGAFAVFASKVLKEGGVVYGAALPFEDGKLIPKHIRVDKIEKLYKLQGSKYVQSDIGTTYEEAREDLIAERKVLFSGTPCNIAGLKKFLRKDYDNLFTVEIICHGVPSTKLFQDFLDDYGNKLGGAVQDFYFRDKSKGQGMITRIVWKSERGEVKEKVMVGGLLSYMNFFLKSYTYRINCYSCPYATKDRVADLTIGDFWGFHEEYPNYKESKGLSNSKGISCVLVNTRQGQNMLNQCNNDFILMSSEFEKVERHNDQLHAPSKYSEKRELILSLYRDNGYSAVDSYFQHNFKKERVKYRISGALPKGFKRKIKKVIRKIK